MYNQLTKRQQRALRFAFALRHMSNIALGTVEDAYFHPHAYQHPNRDKICRRECDALVKKGLMVRQEAAFGEFPSYAISIHGEYILRHYTDIMDVSVATRIEEKVNSI